MGKRIEVITAFGSAQGTISVVSALIAGLSAAMLGTIDEQALNNSRYVSKIFLVSGSLVVSGSLFVCIICSICEQVSKVASGIALVKDDEEYEHQLEKWWRSFSRLRTNAIWVFFFSVPFLFMSLGSAVYLQSGCSFFGAIGGNILGCTGAITFFIIWRLNIKFRKKVLMIDSMFSAPQVSSKTKMVGDNIGRLSDLLKATDDMLFDNVDGDDDDGDDEDSIGACDKRREIKFSHLVDRQHVRLSSPEVNSNKSFHSQSDMSKSFEITSSNNNDEVRLSHLVHHKEPHVKSLTRDEMSGSAGDLSENYPDGEMFAETIYHKSDKSDMVQTES